jgi:hypothetical protein
MNELGARLDRIEASMEIHSLRQRYASAADDKYNANVTRRSEAELQAAARAQADCFTPDARWDGGRFGGTIIGREALFTFFCQSPWQFTFHQYSSIEIIVDEDRASGRWKLMEVAVQEGRAAMLLIGRTEETYVRKFGKWLISSFAFTSLHCLALNGPDSVLRCVIPLNEAP